MSGYLSVFDDWDLLAETLATVAPLLDELVVVDGAYRWMAPLLERQGRDPLRSDPRVHDALQGLPCPVRVITGLWTNELEKRMAGYAACTGRWILRIVADEDWEFTDGDPMRALDRHAVAEVQYPTMITPDWMQSRVVFGRFHTRIGRQGVLFDASRIDAQQHLAYLWLVLGAERESLIERNRWLVRPKVLGFCAHLTHWRLPRTSVNRARFYIMNYMRNYGSIGWAPGVACRAEDGFAAFFDAVPPAAFEDVLLTHEIVSGPPELAGSALRAVPIGAARKARLGALYERHLASLAALNAELRGRPVTMANGARAVIDLSTEAALAGFGVRDGGLKLGFDGPIAAAKAELVTIRPGRPAVVRSAVEASVEGPRVQLRLPPLGPAVRRSLMLEVWDGQGRNLLRMLPEAGTA